MTTLKITVDNQKNARLLTKVLKNMSFIKNIEEENNVAPNQYAILKDMLNAIETDIMFQAITDPVNWQREIRDEW
jgi:hypothetical protein